MACLLVIGGGHRSDVIKNMTMEEWNERRFEKSPDNENKQVKHFNIKIYYNQQHCNKQQPMNHVHQECTTQISLRAEKNFVFMFKGQNLHVFTLLKVVIRE